MYRPNSTKAKLEKDIPVYGMINSLAIGPITEMIGLSGYDFLVIDGEHGTGGLDSQLSCLQAAAATPATAFLRVASNDEVELKRVLDLGIEGVLIPDISTATQAREAVSACLYPPRGKRGFSVGTARASDYGLKAKEYISDDGSELLICVMIESAKGVKNASSIAEVEGVDIVQLGPFDLSYDLGIPGQFDHPKFKNAVAKVEKAALEAGKILGGVPLPGMPKDVLIERGYRFITVGADAPLFSEGLSIRINDFKP